MNIFLDHSDIYGQPVSSHDLVLLLWKTNREFGMQVFFPNEVCISKHRPKLLVTVKQVKGIKMRKRQC